MEAENYSVYVSMEKIMKRWIWNLRVKLGDLIRTWYRKIHPAKKHYKLEIQDSDLKIGDDYG